MNSQNTIKVKSLWNLKFYWFFEYGPEKIFLRKERVYNLPFDIVKILYEKKCVEILEENFDYSVFTIKKKQEDKLVFDIYLFLYYILSLQEFTIDELKETLEKNYLNYDEKKLLSFINLLVNNNILIQKDGVFKYDKNPRM